MFVTAQKLIGAVSNVRKSSKSKDEPTNRSCIEIMIPVPWGQISGKWWGPQHKRPILAIHGFMDNAGSFDRLIPLMSDRVGVLAIDLVGHGRSDKIPAGFFYNEMLILFLIQHIKNYFDWNFVSLLAHSSGAVCAFLYCGLYPHRIDFAIFLDAFYPSFHSKDKKFKNIADKLSTQVQMSQDELQEPAPSTLAALGKVVQMRSGKSIDLNKVDHILERGVEPSHKVHGAYYLNIDPRITTFDITCFDENDCVAATKTLTFPIMVTKTLDSPYFDHDVTFGKYYKALLGSCRFCELHEVQGSHHVHLNEPEKIASSINEFIKNYDKCNRTGGGIKAKM